MAAGDDCDEGRPSPPAAVSSDVEDVGSSAIHHSNDSHGSVSSADVKNENPAAETTTDLTNQLPGQSENITGIQETQTVSLQPTGNFEGAIEETGESPNTSQLQEHLSQEAEECHCVCACECCEEMLSPDCFDPHHFRNQQVNQRQEGGGRENDLDEMLYECPMGLCVCEQECTEFTAEQLQALCSCCNSHSLCHCDSAQPVCNCCGAPDTVSQQEMEEERQRQMQQLQMHGVCSCDCENNNVTSVGVGMSSSSGIVALNNNNVTSVGVGISPSSGIHALNNNDQLVVQQPVSYFHCCGCGTQLCHDTDLIEGHDCPLVSPSRSSSESNEEPGLISGDNKNDIGPLDRGFNSSGNIEPSSNSSGDISAVVSQLSSIEPAVLNCTHLAPSSSCLNENDNKNTISDKSENIDPSNINLIRDANILNDPVNNEIVNKVCSNSNNSDGENVTGNVRNEEEQNTDENNDVNGNNLNAENNNSNGDNGINIRVTETGNTDKNSVSPPPLVTALPPPPPPPPVLPPSVAAIFASKNNASNNIINLSENIAANKINAISNDGNTDENNREQSNNTNQVSDASLPSGPMDIASPAPMDDAFSPLALLKVMSGDDGGDQDMQLHEAARVGQSEVLAKLLTKEHLRGNLNARAMPFMSTPLREAVVGGSVECVQQLLQAGAELDAVDVKGQTALFVAASLNKPNIMEVLLSAGADPEGSRYNNCTPLLICVRDGCTEGVKSLLRHRVDPQPVSLLTTCVPGWPLQHCIVYSRYECFLALLKGGADTSLSAVLSRRTPQIPLDEGVLRRLSITRTILKHASDCPQFVRSYREFGGCIESPDELPLDLTTGDVTESSAWKELLTVRDKPTSLKSQSRLRLLRATGDATVLSALAVQAQMPGCLRNYLEFVDLELF